MSNKKVRDFSVHVYGKEILPDPNKELSNFEILIMLNWYNKNVQKKDKKKYSLQLAEKINYDKINDLKSVPEEWFATIGAVSRIILNGGIVYYDVIEKFDFLVTKKENKIKEVSTVKKKPKDNPNLDNVFETVDTVIDNIILKNSDKSLDNNIIRSLKGADKTELRKYIHNALSEYTNEEFDDYFIFSKFVKDELIKFHKNVLETLKPEKKISPVNLNKVKYLKEVYGIKSVKPQKILEAKKVLLYNTKYKRLIVLRSEGDSCFTILGTTIKNVDLSNSFRKTVRKPEKDVKRFSLLPTKKLDTEFSKLKTKASSATGRLNEDTIILKTYAIK